MTFFYSFIHEIIIHDRGILPFTIAESIKINSRRALAHWCNRLSTPLKCWVNWSFTKEVFADSVLFLWNMTQKQDSRRSGQSVYWHRLIDEFVPRLSKEEWDVFLVLPLNRWSLKSHTSWIRKIERMWGR